MGYSFWESVEHRNDDIKYTGFDYRGNILKKTLSKVLFLEEKRTVILETMDVVLSYLVDHVKHIKKGFNWVLSKHYRDFN